MMRAMVLALLAHVLLIAALTWGVNWRQTESPAVEAEIWSSVTQQAAPRAVEPPAAKPDPQPQPVQPPPPQPKVEAPAPPDTSVRDAQIALERDKKKREVERQRQEELVEREQQRKAAERKKQEQIQKDKAAEKREADALAAKRKAAEQADAKRKADQQDKEQAQKRQAQEAQAAEARRQENIRRMQGLAGASGAPSSSGTAMQSSGPSASYAGRIIGRVRPNIVFTEDGAGNPSAEVEVRCSPDGTIVSRRLLKSSGNKAWDEAVLRAIDKTETFPRDVDGRVPPVLNIGFRPKDG
jgi:colicin import membrane protein